MSMTAAAERAATLFSGDPCQPTDHHEDGPFYRPGAPWQTDLYPADSGGTILCFEGSLTGTSCGPVRNATSEIWQADDHGRYDNDDPANLPDPTFFRCRARFNVDANGRFKLRTVLPANYKPDANDCWVRVKHLHFKFHALGYEPLSTEVALLPDRYTDTDFLFNPHLVAKLEDHVENGRPVLKARFAFVMRPISTKNYLSAVARINPVSGRPAAKAIAHPMWRASRPVHKRSRDIVRYGDVQIEVIVEGRGPLIVMLPSSGRDSEDFDDVAAGIAAAGYRVLRPQPRGMGHSVGPMQDLTLHDFARDVGAVVEKLCAGPAVLVGHAFGNWIARMTAVDHPHLVSGIVLAAAAARTFPTQLSQALNTCADVSLPDTERLQALKLAFFASGHDPSRWLTGWHPMAMKTQRAASTATSPDEWWSAGTAPIFDLQAAQDPWRPRSTQCDLREEFGKRVTVSVIPDASHALIPEQPAAVVNEIVKWVQQLFGAGQ